MLESLGFGLAVGLMAAPHCLGMCGAFPLHLARSSGPGDLAARQFLYVLGKAFTYVFLGALVGFLGEALISSQWTVGSRKVLAGAAGAVMVVCGLQMLGLQLPLPRKWVNIQDWGVVTQLYDYFFRTPGLWAAFVLGLLTGFLPCPVTFGMLVAAGATQSVVRGMVLMGAVGLGTAPALVAVGLFGGALSARFKAVGLRAAGVVLILLGAATMLRGTDLLHGHHDHMHHHAQMHHERG